ncbi:unnamed protein product, partial [Prorocentrum cordatum]
GVAAQLSAVASKLLQAAPTTAPTSTATPSAPPSASGDLTKAQRQAQIKQLEAALIPLQGVEHKQALISDKPLGQRRDNCKDALERAKKRTLQAREALALAEQTVQAAEAEEQRLTQELTDLQHELAEAPVPEEGLDALRAHLAAACDKVASLPGAPADVADHAKSLSADLLSRFEKAFEEQAEAPTGQHAPTPRRHSTKSEPVPGVDTSAPGMPVGTRYQGKQPFKGPVQQPLTNYFTIPAALLAAARHRMRRDDTEVSFLNQATFNVQTLDPKEQRQLRRIGQHLAARTQLIETYLHDRGVHVAGIQEARLPDQGCQELNHYYAFTAAANSDGTGGVQLWIHKDLHATASKAATNVVNPRLLRTEASIAGCAVTAISAHAPVSSAPTQDKRDFWDALHRGLRQARHRTSIIVFIDGNDDDEAHGVNSSYQFSEECRLANHLADAAELLGSEEPTWFGIPGHEKRCDHIWLGPRWQHHLRSVQVYDDSLSFTEREDHKALGAQLALPVLLEEHPPPSLKVSPARLCDEGVRMAFQLDMQQAAHELQQYVHDGPDRYPQQLIHRFEIKQSGAATASRDSGLPVRFWNGEQQAYMTDATVIVHNTSYSNFPTLIAKRTEELALQADAADQSGDAKQLHNTARQLKARKGFRKHAETLDERGTALFDPDEIQRRWERHWSSLFAGICLTVTALSEPPPAGDPLRRPPQRLHRDRVRHNLYRIHPKKGLGPDGISASIWRTGGEAALDMVIPLFDISFTAAQAPIAMKVGKLWDIWKQKGDPAVCGNSRGILVSDHLSKWYCMSIAEPVFRAAPNALGLAQCGSMPGRDAALLTTAIQTFIERALHQRRSWALLFLDLAKAFDSIIREYLYGVGRGKLSDLSADLQRAGIPAPVAQEAQTYLETHPPLLEQAGMTPEDVRQIADWHTGTWFAVREVVGWARFALIWPTSLHWAAHDNGSGKPAGIALELRTPKHVAIPWATALDSREDLHETTSTDVDGEYVDDAVFAFLETEHGGPQQVLDQLGMATDILVHEFARLGLTINFGPGKSAAMVKLFGNGSRKLHQSALLENGREQFTSPGGFALEIVHHFTHLGTIHQDAGGHQADGRRKAAKAQQAFAPLAAPIFGSKAIAEPTRIKLANSLVLSRSLFAVAAWRGQLDRGWRPLEAQYHRVLRRIHGSMRFRAPGTPTDLEVRTALQAPPLASLVRAQRLAGLGSQLQAPPLVMRCIAAVPKPASATHLLTDLRHLAAAFPAETQALGDPFHFPAAWREFILSEPARWRRLCHAFRACPCKAPQSQAAMRRQRGKQPAPLGRVTAPVPTLTCPDCQRECRGPKGLAAHRRHAHGIKMQARFHILGTECPACSKDFYTRPRALHHLQFSSKQCRARMMQGYLPAFSASQVAEADRADAASNRGRTARGETRTRALCPPRPAAELQPADASSRGPSA